MALSIALIISDHKAYYSAQIRAALAIFTTPVQYFVDFPSTVIDWMQTNWVSYRQLHEENKKFRSNQLILQAQVQKLSALERENAALRSLLRAMPRLQNNVTAAQLLAVSSEAFSQRVVINKGAQDHVYVGQPVVDANGVIGQIIQIAPLTSEVLLITDRLSAVPIENTRNGIRAILAGTGSPDRLELINITKTADIQVGDLLVASELGRRFPIGYAVGVVDKVMIDPHDDFAKVLVRPSANLNESKFVLLSWLPR